MGVQAVSFSWLQWHFHPDVILALLLLQGLYLWGVGPLRKRYGWAENVETKRVVWFTGGVIVIYVALTSAIHELANSYLFSAHMVQHLLLVLVAPPMLLVGTPGWLLSPLFRNRWVVKTARVITHPIAAFLLLNAVIGVWHFPSLYDLALQNHGFHIAEHLMFFAVGVISWWPIYSPSPELPRASYPMQMLYLFGLSLPMGFTGAAITFSSTILYPWYAHVPRLWGTNPVEDQQIAGLIMKIPGTIYYLVVMTAVFFVWFNKDEKGNIETGLKELIGPEEAPAPVSKK